MSASFTIAGRNNGFSKADTRAATLASVRAYREAMAGFAQMGTMDVWYARLSEQELLAAIKNLGATGGAKRKKEAKKGEKRAQAIAAKARTRDSLQALSKLAELVDGRYRIISQPPIVVPLRELPPTAELSAGRAAPRDRTSSSARTERRCRATGGTCWSASRSSTSHARSSG